VQVALEVDHEQQLRDADLPQQVDLVMRLHQSEPGRPDGDADHDVGDQHRLAQAHEQRAGQHGAISSSNAIAVQVLDMDGTQAARVVCSASGAWFCGLSSARRHATQSIRTPGWAVAYRFNMTIRILFCFGTAMLSVVLPLTVVTLVVVMLRPPPPVGARSS
jgi:hypothetical protein